MRKLLPTLPLLLLLLGGCANRAVPELIRMDAADSMSVAQAQADPEAARGAAVRWGGEIVDVYNREKVTDIVVLRRDLFSGGEPRPDGGEARRFVARIAGFLDPAEYRQGQRLTVVGRLEGIRSIEVGDYAYPHPLVEVQQYYRWGKYVEPYAPPWYRDPFYCDPFDPLGYRRPFCW